MKRKRFLLRETGNSKMRKVFLFLAAVAVYLCMAGEAMGQVIASGETGDCTWTITGTSGDYTLIISGNGSMGNYYYASLLPIWYSFRTGIKTVDIQQGVTSIGNSAFYGCSSLTSVTIPNSVTSIGSYAFSGCSGLTSVIIGNSVTSIEGRAFNGCTGLTAVTIPNSVASIGFPAFSGCTNLITVNFNAVNCTFAEMPFSECEAFTTLNIGEEVTTIPSAFSGCTGLTSVTIPNSVTSIGDVAFYNCSGLTSVAIPNSVTSIGEGAFRGCDKLATITGGNGLSRIGSRAFHETQWYNEKDDNSEVYIGTVFYSYKWKFEERDLDNPPSVSIEIAEGTLGIADEALRSYDGSDFNPLIRSVTLPNSLTHIGNWAFIFCFNLSSIILPNSLTNIGAGAFNSTGLSSITLPPNLQFIGESAFISCNLLLAVYSEAVTAPTLGSTHIFSSSYTAPPAGQTLYLKPNATGYESSKGWPSSQARILSEENGLIYSVLDVNAKTAKVRAGSGFNTTDLSAMRQTVLYDGETYRVTVIEANAFKDNQTLASVTIPNSVTFIGDYAFYECRGLTSVTIPHSVTSIGNHAFHNCIRLNSVILSNSVTSIGEDAFRACSSLTSVTIPNSVTSIGEDAFHDCSSLTSVTIPHSVTSIGDEAFRNCPALTTVNFNAINCRTMGAYNYPVFADCTALTTLNIGNEVETIPSSAFSGCTGLKKLVIAESTRALPFNYSKSYSPYTNDIFADCPLDTVYLGRNITYNNTYDNNTAHDFSPFYNQTTIQYLTVGNQVTAIDNSVFYGCSPKSVITPVVASSLFSSGLEKLTITAACTSLSSGCFAAATGLKELSLPFIGTSPTSPRTLSTLFGGTVPVSLKKLSVVRATESVKIASGALSGCDRLEELTIGALVSGIESDALKGCYNIRNIYVHSAMAPVAYNGIAEEVYSGCILHVPSGRHDHYAGRTGWKEFLNCGGINEENPLEITAIPVPLKGGSITAGNAMQYGYYDEATLEAAGSWGYDFKCWMEGSSIVSTDNPYIFTVTAPRTLYAIFTPRENADENIQIQAQSQSASISWTAVTDATNYTLVIYRDDNRTDTVAVFRLDANGEVLQSSRLRAVQQDLSCSITDLTAETQYYYSLTSYDAEDYALTIAIGDFTTQSSGLGIESVESREIRLYPNPVKESFRIAGLTAPTQVTLTDVNGRTVLQQTVNGDESISVRHLPQGVYLVRANGQTAKIIKN